MQHFPIFLDLRHRRVLVVGGGEVATRKAEPLRRCGADVRVTPRFNAADLSGCVLAVGADAPEADLQALSLAARSAGIPVNVVDRPELCSFIMPALVERDPITVAVSSSGTAPVLARLVRAQIEALLPPALGRLATLADQFKDALRSRIPNIAHRRRVLERLLDGRTADLVFAGREDAAAALFAAAIDSADADVPPPGIVYLVGAGPGARDLLTLRAQRLLGEADVIVHDRLVSSDVLDMARRDAERIHVGKRRAEHCLPQAEINALLVRLGQEGRRVVRLKGGDPFIFGRGGEEMQALAAAGIAVEVVPGITAACGVSCYAGIPLTHRDHAQSCVFVTGHLQDGTTGLDWAALARPRQTVVIYMGLGALGEICTQLVAHGMGADMPAAVVEKGTTLDQRVVTGTLRDLAARVATSGLASPCLIIVGEVVRLRDSLAWFGPAQDLVGAELAFNA